MTLTKRMKNTVQLREQCLGRWPPRGAHAVVVSPPHEGGVHVHLRPPTTFEMMYKNVAGWSPVLEETLTLGSWPSGRYHQQSGRESLLSTVQ